MSRKFAGLCLFFLVVCVAFAAEPASNEQELGVHSPVLLEQSSKKATQGAELQQATAETSLYSSASVRSQALADAEEFVGYLRNRESRFSKALGPERMEKFNNLRLVISSPQWPVRLAAPAPEPARVF